MLECELIKIIIKNDHGNGSGVTRTEYYVHKSLLQQESLYFRALDNFKERDEAKVEFSNMSLSAFNIFFRWLYTSDSYTLAESEHLDDLLEAYMLGSRLMSAPFQDYVLDGIQSIMSMVQIPPELLRRVRDSELGGGSPLADFFIDLLAYKITTKRNFLEENNLLPEYSDLVRGGGNLIVRLIEKIQQECVVNCEAGRTDLNVNHKRGPCIYPNSHCYSHTRS